VHLVTYWCTESSFPALLYGARKARSNKAGADKHPSSSSPGIRTSREQGEGSMSLALSRLSQKWKCRPSAKEPARLGSRCCRKGRINGPSPSPKLPALNQRLHPGRILRKIISSGLSKLRSHVPTEMDKWMFKKDAELASSSARRSLATSSSETLK